MFVCETKYNFRSVLNRRLLSSTDTSAAVEFADSLFKDPIAAGVQILTFSDFRLAMERTMTSFAFPVLFERPPRGQHDVLCV